MVLDIGRWAHINVKLLHYRLIPFLQLLFLIYTLMHRTILLLHCLHIKKFGFVISQVADKMKRMRNHDSQSTKTCVISSLIMLTLLSFPEKMVQHTWGPQIIGQAWVRDGLYKTLKNEVQSFKYHVQDHQVPLQGFGWTILVFKHNAQDLQAHAKDPQYPLDQIWGVPRWTLDSVQDVKI